jgi:hypothetical protein
MIRKFEFAGKRLKRISKYKFWKDDNHAIYLDPFQPEMIDQKMEYIHNNPVSALLVEYPQHYLFSSARDYFGGKGLVDIALLH